MAQLATEAAGSLAERAYHAVRDMIVSLELPPGAVVSERELIEKLAIGRTPMHEALHRLAREKFVEVYPRRGMFVTTVEIRDLAALCEVRVALEGQAARLAAQKVDEDDCGDIDAVLDELEKVGGGTQRELMQFDERIHRMIYRLARNEFLEMTAEQYYVHALRIWYLALGRTPGLQAAVKEHDRLLEAIAARDADRAERLMREHVLEFEEAMARVLLPA